MGLMDLAGSAGAALRKVPGLKQIAGYQDEYVNTGSKKALAKSMAPFAAAAALPVAMYAGGTAVGGQMLAGVGTAGRAASSKISNLSGGLGKVAQSVKNVARKPVVKGTAGAGLAAGAGAIGYSALKNGTPDPNDAPTGDDPTLQTAPAPDEGGGGGGGNWSPDAEDYAKQKSRFINDTEDSYKNLKKAIKSQLKFGDQFVGDMESKIKSLVESYISTLGEQKRVGMEQLGTMKEDVRDSQRKSLRGLAENVRSGFLQGNALLGGVGASDSSAGKQYSGSLIKQANVERSAIKEEIDGQFKELSNREGQVTAYAESELEKINSWKESKIGAIKSSFDQYRKALSKAYSKADDNKKKDIEALDQKRLQKAYQDIQKIVDQSSQWENVLVGVHDEMLGKIDSIKQYIIENTDYTPKEIEVNELSDLGDVNVEDENDPVVQQQKKRKKMTQSFLGNPLTDDEEFANYDEDYSFA
jgi:hypothetical protein